jgi:RNA-directed DNA polymerase
MSKLESLRKATKHGDLAALLGVRTAALTYVVYKLKPHSQYTKFSIDKKSGGKRIIFAPSPRLKTLQSSLSDLLQDCIDEINSGRKYTPSLSHGFVRKRTILTNAEMHLNKKNVLNVDLENFFDSFNFGRVRGFFIANRNFEIDPYIATIIAQIACHENKLPQGSPCSPVISNLITHSLDIRLSSLAKSYSCTYSRYADDITLSTRNSKFPPQIMRIENGEYIPGKRFLSEIVRSGFNLNESKTRIQYKDSRQDVTGLIVNKRPGVKSEYWRTARSQCHELFRTGGFFELVNGREVPGNLNKLHGKLNFIDQIDRHNRITHKMLLNPHYQLVKSSKDKSKLLNARERTLGKFLHYRLFYANDSPTILCEGKTDNIYIKAAVLKLSGAFPLLSQPSTAAADYKLLVRLLEYTKRTRFLLELYGGTSYLAGFISHFEKRSQLYKAPPPVHPVIIVADNDSGFAALQSPLNKMVSTTTHPNPKSDYVDAEFIHVTRNLYIVLTPKGAAGAPDSVIEDLFDNATRNTRLSGKTFNPANDADSDIHYGKHVFATKIVQNHKSTINFDGFRPLLQRISDAISHYSSIRGK